MIVNLQPGGYQAEAPAQGDPIKQLTLEFTALGNKRGVRAAAGRGHFSTSGTVRTGIVP
jgi:hypothetical protein